MDQKGEGKGWHRHSRQENSMCQGTRAEIGIVYSGRENSNPAGLMGPSRTQSEAAWKGSRGQDFRWLRVKVLEHWGTTVGSEVRDLLKASFGLAYLVQ